jgi:2-polyprenyl-3-methyl-5-hydroxy-6-metoxy-1,4-benzoquinol methylase
MSFSSVPPFVCPVCQAKFSGALVATETVNNSVLGIQRCTGCGLHITYPRLETPQAHYFHSNRAEWDDKFGKIVRGEQLHDRHQNYVEEAETLRQFLPNGGHVLDVGCSVGWLLGYIQKLNLYDLEGLEPSPFSAQIAQERLHIPIHTQYLHQLEGESHYDAIFITDVIEHVNPEDQALFMQSIVRLLKQGGFLFVKTPNVSFTALKSRIAKQLPASIRQTFIRNHDMWDAKEHVILWDEQTLCRHLENVGLHVKRLFVPKPIETRNSPIGARVTRKVFYRLARWMGGTRHIPSFAQDIMLVAQK